jgi:hypothetical protein
MERARRYPGLGGLAAWRVPGLFGTGALCAGWTGEWGLAGFFALLGLVWHGLDASLQFEVSAVGLSRLRLLGGVPLGAAHVLPWRAVREVRTRWAGGWDMTGLETVVLGAQGERMRVTTRMGLPAYRALVADIVTHAPGAARTGLTDQLLREAAVEGRALARVRRLLLGGAALLVLVWVLAS